MTKNKVLKRTGIIFISSFILLFISWQLLKELKIKTFVVDSLQTELNNYFEDSVKLVIEDISFNFFEKQILLEKINVNLIANQIDTLASMEIPNLNISWDNYRETFNNQFYQFNTLELINAKILLPIDFSKIKRTKASKPSFEGEFELDIKEFNMKDGDLLFYDERNKKSGRIKAKYYLTAKNIHFQKDKILNDFQDVAEEIILEFNELTYFLKDDLHKIDIEKLTFDLFKQHISLSSTHYRPVYSPEKFAKLKGEEANYIDILLDSIQLKDIRWQGDSMISINSILTKDIILQVFKDKNYPLPDDRFVPILINLLKESEISIDVRSLIVDNMDLTYTEIPEGSKEKGVVILNNINGEITNITNRSDSIIKNGKYLAIKADADFYGEGRLDADIQYDLTSRYGYFKVYGSLQPMEIGAFNSYLAKSYPIEISSGRVDELFFSYSGGNRAVSGEMEFKYSDFKIKFHKVLNEEEKGDKALSWLANVALSQKNPRNNGKYRVGRIEFKRDTRKSMFSYWSNSLVSGFQSTLGLEKPARVEKLEQDKDDRNLWQKIGIGKEDESE
ncbi:hypothetical protein [Marivirga sp.]|uniref:hypothetical protein n=1 Tax=Marivirga sp. TaxID=2018662 RepID=UPI003DA791A7